MLVRNSIIRSGGVVAGHFDWYNASETFGAKLGG